jgi:tektin-3
LTFWRNEARTELERLLTESDLLQEARRSLEKAIADIEGPLHIAQECLYQRENRQGIDLVHDNAEQSLLQEVEIYRNSQEKLKCLYERIKDQLRNNRAAQHELETDVRSKEGALGIDNMCHQLNNFSKGINYYGGIEKYDPSYIRKGIVLVGLLICVVSGCRRYKLGPRTATGSCKGPNLREASRPSCAQTLRI